MVWIHIYLSNYRYFLWRHNRLSTIPPAILSWWWFEWHVVLILGMIMQFICVVCMWMIFVGSWCRHSEVMFHGRCDGSSWEIVITTNFTSSLKQYFIGPDNKHMLHLSNIILTLENIKHWTISKWNMFKLMLRPITVKLSLLHLVIIFFAQACRWGM